jgi:hypothetical protein
VRVGQGEVHLAAPEVLDLQSGDERTGVQQKDARCTVCIGWSRCASENACMRAGENRAKRNAGGD